MLIIFDLDGTLIDSAKDLAVSMNAMRKHLGMPALEPALIYSFVGNGAAMWCGARWAPVQQTNWWKKA